MPAKNCAENIVAAETATPAALRRRGTQLGGTQLALRAALPRRRRDPFSRLIAAGVALMMALSTVAATSVPARADSDSDTLLKALIGIGAVAIIANEVKKDKKRDRQRDDWRDEDDWRRSYVPSRCAIDIDAGRGRSGTVYSESCMRREGVEGRMPRNCGHDIRFEGRRDRVFSEDCLREAGFRTDRRRY